MIFCDGKRKAMKPKFCKPINDAGKEPWSPLMMKFYNFLRLF